MVSALIHSNFGPDTRDLDNIDGQPRRKQLRLDNAFRIASRSNGLARGPSATLIVAPTSLLTQWFDELQKCSKPGVVNALVWHGQNRLDVEAAIDDEKSINVIITSYGVLASEHAKVQRASNQASPLFRGMELSFVWLLIANSMKLNG